MVVVAGIKSCALNSHLRTAARQTFLRQLLFSFVVRRQSNSNDNGNVIEGEEVEVIEVLFLPFFLVGRPSEQPDEEFVSR